MWRRSSTRGDRRKDQVTAILNDYGFFLTEEGKHEPAINVLQMVIARAPDRAVAYLNLADAEYARGDKPAATGHYRRYAELMKEAGKTEMIAPRVSGRMSALGPTDGSGDTCCIRRGLSRPL